MVNSLGKGEDGAKETSDAGTGFNGTPGRVGWDGGMKGWKRLEIYCKKKRENYGCLGVLMFFFVAQLMF